MKFVHGAVLTKTRNANFYMAQFFVEKTRKNTQRRFSQRDKHTASISEPHFSVLLLLQPFHVLLIIAESGVKKRAAKERSACEEEFKPHQY